MPCGRKLPGRVTGTVALPAIEASSDKALAERESRRRSLPARPGARNVLIVGAGQVGQQLADYFERHPQMGRSVCGFLDDQKRLENNVVGRSSDLAKLARRRFVDEVILAAPHDRELTLRVLHAARDLRLDVKIAPDLFGCETKGATERVGSIPLFSLHQEQVPATRLLLKRALDLVVSVATLILLAPLLGLIALLIRLDSPGPFCTLPLAQDAREGPFAATSIALW